MAETGTDPRVGDPVILHGRIKSLNEGVALVEVYRSYPVGGTVAVQCGALELDESEHDGGTPVSDEDLIRDAMAEAQDIRPHRHQVAMAVRTRRDMQRWARKGTTEQRGYGTAHRGERERRLLLYRPGDQCAIGGEPLNWWPLTVARRFLDLPHDHANGGYLPGLSCRTHNRREGAVRGNRMRGRARAWQASRRW